MVSTDGTNVIAPVSENSSGFSTSRPELPALPYSIRDHLRNIIFIWTLFTLDTAVLPLLLFYALWYHSSQSPTNILTITTCVFGIFATIEWATRTLRLWKMEEVRPIGGGRKGFDFFHFSYSIGYAIGIVELIIGTAPDEPSIRLCALPGPSFVLFFGLILLLSGFLSAVGARAPFRISSIPKGAPLRPTVYTIVEDVIGVGTGTGRRYREALNARYEASSRFRRMLAQSNVFWGLSAILVGVATIMTVSLWDIPLTVAYGIGWAAPPIWAMLWAAITTLWVQRSLRKEKAEWHKRELV